MADKTNTGRRENDWEVCPVGTLRALNATRLALQAVLKIIPKPRQGKREMEVVAKARKVAG